MFALMQDKDQKSDLNPATSVDGSAESPPNIQISYRMYLLICFDMPAHAFSEVAYLISGRGKHLSNNINSASLQGSTIQSYKTENPR